jgi:hypothetical protein
MGVANDIKKLGEDIVDSYDLRVKEIRKLAKDTQSTLKGFQGEQKKMAAELRKTLEQGEADRLKASGSLKNEIQAEQAKRNKEVADLLEKFSKDHEDMAAELRKTLEQGEADRLKASGSLKNEIQARKDERNKEVLDLLQEFKTEREKMSANWQSLNTAMAKRRSGKPTMEAEVKVRPVKEAIKEETKEDIASPEIGVEEKVLEFIKRHPKGVKVGDMEEPLRVLRMRLGVVAKGLLGEGKVRKEDDMYFPL